MTNAMRPTAAYGSCTQYPGRQIYIIGEPGSPTVKIGVAVNVTNRLNSLRAGDATLRPESVDVTRLVVLHHEAGDRRLEAELHYRFRSRCVVGEWFDLGVLAVQLIKSVIRDVRYSQSL